VWNSVTAVAPLCGETVEFQWCYIYVKSGVTVELHWCHCGVIVVSQWCSSGVTSVLKWCYGWIRGVLQQCFSGVTVVLPYASPPGNSSVWGEVVVLRALASACL
jgi:hypothetical protein